MANNVLGDYFKRCGNGIKWNSLSRIEEQAKLAKYFWAFLRRVYISSYFETNPTPSKELK